MCAPKISADPIVSQAETPVYAEETPAPMEAPKLEEPEESGETASIKAKRKGTRQLRTDLGGVSGGRTGLNIN